MIRRISNWLKQNKHAWLALYLPIYLIGFFWVESYVPSDSNYWVSYTPLDDLIPFVEYFVIPYYLWYPFMVVTGLYLLFHDCNRSQFYCEHPILCPFPQWAEPAPRRF